MDTKSPLAELLARIPAGADLPMPTTSRDVDRLAAESHHQREGLIVRDLRSHGTLRLHGQTEGEHAAPLALVGSVATAWQKAVTAVGAALEGMTQARGRLPLATVVRTTLEVLAPPSPGSLVVELSPVADPVEEAEPKGNVAMFDAERPLADQAAGRLIELCRVLAEADPQRMDDLADEIRTLGPRVGGAVRGLAEALAGSALDLEASWEEPGRPTIRSDWSPQAATWVAAFIKGRDLDAEKSVLTGVAVTVSERERWLVTDDAGEAVYVQVGSLTPEDTHSVRPSDRIELEIESTSRVTPTGEVHTTRKALRLLKVQPGDPA